MYAISSTKRNEPKRNKTKQNKKRDTQTYISLSSSLLIHLRGSLANEVRQRAVVVGERLDLHGREVLGVRDVVDVHHASARRIPRVGTHLRYNMVWYGMVLHEPVAEENTQNTREHTRTHTCTHKHARATTVGSCLSQLEQAAGDMDALLYLVGGRNGYHGEVNNKKKKRNKRKNNDNNYVCTTETKQRHPPTSARTYERGGTLLRWDEVEDNNKNHKDSNNDDDTDDTRAHTRTHENYDKHEKRP